MFETVFIRLNTLQTAVTVKRSEFAVLGHRSVGVAAENACNQ
jgi:hypothetical protein